jgi:hypothetical protein
MSRRLITSNTPGKRLAAFSRLTCSSLPATLRSCHVARGWTRFSRFVSVGAD